MAGLVIERQTSCSITFSVDVEYTNGALITHTLFGYTNDLVISFVKSNAFDGCGKFPFVQAFA